LFVLRAVVKRSHAKNFRVEADVRAKTAARPNPVDDYHHPKNYLLENRDEEEGH
jgi:hypothetical protein